MVQEKARWVAKGLTWAQDPLEFALEFGLWKLPVKPKECHREWLREAARFENLLIEAPKDWAKSTCMSFIFPIWAIALIIDIRIKLVSSTLHQAIDRVSAIRRELENNLKLRQVFGDFRGRPWKDSKFTTAQRRNKSLVDPTLQAVGIGSSSIGGRSDLIIPDDIITIDNAGTPERRAKTKVWFWQTLGGTREKHTPIVCVGTRQHYGDLWGELESDPQFRVMLKYAKADYIDENGQLQSNWPELWPVWRLKKLMEQSRTAYDRDRRNMPMSQEDAPVPEEWLAAAKAQGENLEFGQAKDQLGLHPVVQAWDVAGLTDPEEARRRDTSYYACVTIGKNRDGKRVVADIWRQRGLSPQAWLSAVSFQAKRHKPDVIIVETVGVQHFHRKFAQDGLSLPIRGHDTTASHKIALRSRTASLSVRLENHDYVFPYAGQRTRSLVDELSIELNQFGAAAHSDIAMALFMADEHLPDVPASATVASFGSPRMVSRSVGRVPRDTRM